MRGFFQSIKKQKNGCWNWQGAKNSGGYGYIYVSNGLEKGFLVAAHRFSYELHNGTIGRYKVVMHKCDNKLCVNPKHLREGTHKENVEDMYKKKRNVKVIGEDHFNAKLTRKDVLKIRKSKDRVTDICSAYGITRSHVYKIKSKAAWSHI